MRCSAGVRPDTPERPGAGGGESLRRLEKQVTLLVRRTMEAVWASGYAPDEAVDRYTYPILLLLDDEGPHSLSALTAQLGVSKPTASRQVSRLARSGLVAVTPGPHDPRSVTVTLTDAGAAARDRVRDARLGPLREVMHLWPEQDRERLALLLDRFNADLEEFARHPAQGGFPTPARPAAPTRPLHGA